MDFLHINNKKIQIQGGRKMTPEKVEELMRLKDLVITFLNDLLGVFLVDGLSLEWQQLVKVSIIVLVFAFLFLVLWFLGRLLNHVIKPLVESLSTKPEYIMVALLSMLLLFFTSEIAFGQGFIAMFAFFTLPYVYDWLKTNQKKNQERRIE
jgi:hypothetical protein